MAVDSSLGAFHGVVRVSRHPPSSPQRVCPWPRSHVGGSAPSNGVVEGNIFMGNHMFLNPWYYVHIYKYLSVFIYIYVYVFAFMCIHVYIFVYMCMCVYVFMCICICICLIFKNVLLWDNLIQECPEGCCTCVI